MPSWSEFLLPHPDPHAQAMYASPPSPSATSHSHPRSPRQPSLNAHPNSQYTQPSPHPGIRHHLSAQGYLQPPPRSRYRPTPPPLETASGSSSAQSSVQDLLALRLVVSASGHQTNQKGRARADSAIISSASCTSFSCASARGQSSWQSVAEVFGARGKEKEMESRKRGLKGKTKEKGKVKERSPPPRIGVLAFEVGEDQERGQVSEIEDEMGWENVTMEEAAGSDVYDEGWRHDWGTRKIGLAISRTLLRSRSGDNLDRHNRYWSGRGGGGGSEAGITSGPVGVGMGRVRGGTETPRATAQRRGVSDSKGKKIAIGANENTDAVDLIHRGFRAGGIGLTDTSNDQHAPAVGLTNNNPIKPPVISINGVELVGGVVGPLSSNGRSSVKPEKPLSPTPERSSPPPPTFPSSNVPTLFGLSSASPCSSPSTSFSPALNASEVSPANINKRKRRHRPDRACAVDDDTGLRCSVQSPAACLSSFSSSSGRPGNNEDGPVVLDEGQGGGRKAGMDGDTHADVNGAVTSMHERGGKFKREVPGDRIIDDNMGMGVEGAAVDDGDIDSVIACDPRPLRGLTHNHHDPRLLRQDEVSEDTPVVRSRPLPLARSFSTSHPHSPPLDSPLDSVPTSRPVFPSCSQPTAPSNNSSVQSSPSLPSFIHYNSSHPDVNAGMGLLNMGIAMLRPPSPSRVTQDAASTSETSVASKTAERSKVTKKSSKRKPSGSLDASSSTYTSRPDVTNDSQLHLPTMPSPPTLGAPRVVSPLEFDPATYFESFPSAPASAALRPNAGLTSSSSSSTSAPTRSAKLAHMDSGVWGPREMVVEDDGSGSDSEDDSHVGVEAKRPVNEKPPMSPSILPSVLALTTLETSEELKPATEPSLPLSPQQDAQTLTPTLPSFAPVAPLSIAKKNPKGNQWGQQQQPPSGSALSVASLLARRFSFRSKSSGNLRSSYLQTSSAVAPRPSSPSPLRNESFERRIEEVVFMSENIPTSSETLGSTSAPAARIEEGSEVSPASLPISTPPLEGKLTPGQSLNPLLSSSPSKAPSTWTTQKLDLSRSPSNSFSSSASSMDTFFEFGTGMTSSGSGSSSSGSKVTTPGTSPGPQLVAIAGPLSESLAKRWRRWSNNLGVWEPEEQKVKEQQRNVGSNSNFGARGMPNANANTNASTSQKQIQEQKLFGRSTNGEGGVVGRAEGGASQAGNTENTEATRDGLEEALSVLGGGTGVEGVRALSASTSIDSTTTTMPSSVSLSSPTASVPAATSHKLVKPRPNLRTASVGDQHHHDLQPIFSTGDAPAATSPSSSHLRTTKPKFTIGGHSYTSSDNPESPKASSFSVNSTTDEHPASTHGSAAASSNAANETTANGLTRRDTFRPPLIRRDAVVAPEQATRRWTLASAITDEAISDEGLLKELERIRVVSEWDRRRARAVAREKAKGKSVDRRTRALSLHATEVTEDAEGQGVQTGKYEDGAEQADEEEEENEEVQLWEIDVGVEIWEGREGMLAREREREMERARVLERQKLDREDERADADAASISTGSSGHSSSSGSAENCTDTTPETTPALSPLVVSPGFAAAASSSTDPSPAAKSALSNSAANKTNMANSLVAQPGTTWPAAQRALLICRELILTERRYLGLMRLLLDTHSPAAGHTAHHLSHSYSGMRTSASTSDIQSLQPQYQGIQQQLQYHPSAATTTHSLLPPVSSPSSPQQTHALVGPPPPTRMFAATVPLADTTMRFLNAMEGAPSVGGVAKAFVDHEAEMEEVYVAWCREVGAWFVDGPTDAASPMSGDGSGQASQEISRIPSPPGSTDGHTSHSHEDGSGGSSTIRLVPILPPTPPLPGILPYAGIVSANAPATSSSPTSSLKRVAGSWRRSMTSIPSLVGCNNGSGNIYGANNHTYASERKREKERERKGKEPLITATASGEPATVRSAVPMIIGGGHALSIGGGVSTNGALGGLGSRVAGSGSGLNAGASSGMEVPPAKPLRKLGVRDLAILPTQRVMRYVLLYRDLLAHTPTSASSRVLVEQALAVATRIADNCDRAQGHSAFIAPNTTSFPPAAPSPNPNTTQSHKNPTSLLPAGSLSGLGTGSGQGTPRSGSGTSNTSNTSGNGWRRKAKSRSRTASLTATPIPMLGSMTAMRSSILQKT